MELHKGQKYLYTNTVRVGRACKRVNKELVVEYVGSEGDKQVFITETGTELLLHNCDIEKLIKETS